MTRGIVVGVDSQSRLSQICDVKLASGNSWFPTGTSDLAIAEFPYLRLGQARDSKKRQRVRAGLAFKGTRLQAVLRPRKLVSF
jgi:hypothetical protein